MNPGQGIVGSLTSGFKPSVLMSTVPVIGGALGNKMLSGFLSGFMPSMLQSGIGNYALGIASAGLLGAGVGMVSPRYASSVFFGGIVEVMMRMFKSYIPGLSGMLGSLTGIRGLGYIGDYLTRQDAATARPLGYLGKEAIPDTEPALMMPETGYGQSSIAEELMTGEYLPDEQGIYESAILRSQTPVDVVFEGTASEELSMS
jgi:hypothetical protein